MDRIRRRDADWTNRSDRLRAKSTGRRRFHRIADSRDRRQSRWSVLSQLRPGLPILNLVAVLTEQIGAVESVKAASDIFAPVSGQIASVNATLGDQPGLLNQSPEADGQSFRSS